MEHLFEIAEGAFLMGLGIFGYLTVKNGVPWAWGKLSTWWQSTKHDIAGAKTDIASLKTDVAALKVKVGL